MSRLGRILRAFFVWWLPTLVLLMALVGGLAFWLMASERGTRFLLTTVANQFDGRAEDIRGSLLEGVQAGHLSLDLPGVNVDIDGLDVALDWKALSDRRVHVRHLAAARLNIALTRDPDAPVVEDEAGAPFSLPVNVTVDDLRVDQFHLTQDGEPLPIGLSGLQATVAASGATAQLRVNALRVSHPLAETDIEGEIELDSFSDPFPMRANIIAAAHSADPESILCLDRVWADTQAGGPNKTSESAAAKSAVEKNAATKSASTSKAATMNKAAATNKERAAGNAPDAATSGVANSSNSTNGTYSLDNAASDASLSRTPPPLTPASCVVLLTATADGSLAAMDVKLNGQGSGIVLDATAALTLKDLFPVRTAQATLKLPDGSGLDANVAWNSTADGAQTRDRLTGKLDVNRLDVGRLVGEAIPPALISLTAGFDVALIDQQTLEQATLDIQVAEGSRWNRQPLSGHVRAGVKTDGSGNMDPLENFQIDNVDIDLRVANDRLRAQGNLGQAASAITLNLEAPRLSALWPDIPGGATLKGRIGGTIAAHEGELDANYVPDKSRAGQVGLAPANAVLRFKGGWGAGSGADAASKLVGWRGTLSALRAAHAGFGVDLARDVQLSFLPEAQAPLWQWQVGTASVGISFPGKQRMTLAHAGSRGGGGRWETIGSIDNAVINRELIRGIMGAIDPETLKRDDRETRQINSRAPASARQIALDANWNLKFDGTLSGQARVARRSGDLLIPGDPPVPLSLRNLAVDIGIKPVSARSSRIDAKLVAATEKMGNIDGTGSAIMVVSPDGAMGLDPRQPIRAQLNARIADLSWVGLFTGDAVEIGGALDASVEASGLIGGDWKTSGTINGRGLRIVQIDNGIRLFDGTLSARLEENTFILNSLRFPATLRVLPDEWRTREWVTQNPDAKNGFIEAKGSWALLDNQGKVRVDLYRFPILQRSDRYAMVSGGIDIDAALPRVSITGDITSDAGWVSLEILQSVPTLDDDVHVRRPGDAERTSVPLQMTMNLKYDMGPRFYITGMGLNAGIVGSMQIQMRDNRLTGAGVLRTRGGRIEAYGQGLQLRRGTVTFQGPLDNPILDIEALRTNQQVEAGVRVGGTAQRPRIDLVSYPDVSDVEKLSWLILGRGPDDGGGEAALLLSAGAALLGGDEPFYRKFGLDDVTVRSGSIGSSGSILPDRTVASNVNRSSDDLATQFIVASKRFANGITLSVEQSMSGSGTVARASYLLTRGLSADLKVGTINGLSLVYRTFFR